MESVAKIRVLEVISDSSSIRFTGHVAGDGLFEVARVGVESNEFLVQCFELFLEVFVAHGLAGSHAQVTAGVERPALRFNFLERGRLAQAGHIGIRGLRAEHLLQLHLGLGTALGVVQRLAAVQPHHIGNEADLRGRPVAVGAVHLAVNVAGVDEQDGVLSIDD